MACLRGTPTAVLERCHFEFYNRSKQQQQQQLLTPPLALAVACG